MRSITRSALAALVLLVCGCNGQGGSPLTPGANGLAGSALGVDAQPGAAILQGPIAQSTLGIFAIDVDLDSLTATTTLARTGAASDNTYELPLAEFIQPTDFEVLGVHKSPTTVDITYRVTHPIPELEDLNAAPTAINRADLGAVLRVLFLNDVAATEGNTFFAEDGEPVIAETTLVSNPHGYFTPKGLVKLGSSTLANTFPYRLVVDEAANNGLGNRDGIDGVAGSFGMGNYDPLLGGWQRHNLGVSNTGWTGYGVLHQGQAATSTVRLNRALLGTGSTFRFETALVAKYIDPRGGSTGIVRRSNRLPKADGDPIAFAYRMPYGALDCETVRFDGESGGFTPDGEAYSVISFHVRDYDAMAVETTVGDLALDPNVSSVQRGGSGVPTLSIDIPGVLPTPYTYLPTELVSDDSAFAGDPEEDSGMAGDELFYSATITKPNATIPVGSYLGLAKVTDVEAGDLDRPDYYFAVDDQLVPLEPGLVPEPVTYQAFQVLVQTPNATPQATGSFVSGVAAVDSGSTMQLQIDSYSDGELDPSTFEADYDFDGTFFSDIVPVEIEPSSSFPVVFPESANLVNQVSAEPIQRIARIRYTDGFHANQILDLPYTLGGNQQPTADIAMVNPSAVVDSIIQLAITNEQDAERNPVSYDIDWDYSGVEEEFVPDYPFVSLPSSLAQLPHQAPSTVGTYMLGVRIKDALHPAGVIVPITYDIVPPNQQATLTFSLPATVQSAETITLTVTDYDDFDGDPVQIKIDWNGDLDFNDPGENSLPPVTMDGQTYTSPVLINNISATPRPATTVIVEYTDNISPHPVENRPIGSYVLGGNRPPVVAGAPIIQTTPLAPAATFRILQNGATATDPEGNTITYTLRGVPNSGGATNTTYSNFSNMLSAAYMNPTASSVNFTVYANDALHPTTNGTAYPGPLTGTICDTYVVSYLFDTGADGWTAGETFSPALPNTDDLGWSNFVRCTNMGSGMVGDMWTTGPDTGEACDFRRNDYGPNLNNNVVSPGFSLIGLSKANVVFNSTKTGRLSTCHYRVYVSTDDGGSWTQVYDTVRTGATAGTTNESNVTVSLNSYIGQPNVRLRFQMQDTSGTTFGAAPFAGWSFDNVRITGCP